MMFGSRKCRILPSAYSPCLASPSCIDERKKGTELMSVLAEEEEVMLQRGYRCQSDNQAKQITQRKGDVPRKGAEEVLIRCLK